ncbi:MAG: PepSY domain-containing protein [Rhodanobacter sp.]
MSRSGYPVPSFSPDVDAMLLAHRLLKIARTIHLYLGVFSAPMLLFFAVTGGLQTFSLHETSGGSSYTPPAWLASMAQLHKKQTLMVSPKKRRPTPASVGEPEASAATASVSAQRPASDKTPTRNLLPMKIFFALIALGLLVSVLSGLCMAWRFSRKPGLFGSVLIGGIAVPLLLLLF